MSSDLVSAEEGIFICQYYIFSVESANILLISVSKTKFIVYLFEYFRIRCNRRQFIFYVESTSSLNKCFPRTQRKLIGSNHSDIAKKIAKIILFSVQSTSSLVISISMMKRMVSLFESFRVYWILTRLIFCVGSTSSLNFDI